MAANPLPVLPDEEVRFVHADEARFCLDCRAVSNTKGDCPACGSGKLWLLEKWLERVPDSTEGGAL